MRNSTFSLWTVLLLAVPFVAVGLWFLSAPIFLMNGPGGRDEAFLETDELPSALVYLPPPPDWESEDFKHDLARHERGKVLRAGPLGEKAAIYADYTLDNLCSVFSAPFGREISATATPELYALLDGTTRTVANAGRPAKREYMRERPYARLGEHTVAPQFEEVLRTNGSYPSGHASGGWIAALVLAEVNPAAAEALIVRGLEIGDSRVISGFHWQSDVDAARIVAAATLARLHADPDFLERMRRAKKEFARGSAR